MTTASTRRRSAGVARRLLDKVDLGALDGLLDSMRWFFGCGGAHRLPSRASLDLYEAGRWSVRSHGDGDEATYDGDPPTGDLSEVARFRSAPIDSSAAMPIDVTPATSWSTA